MSLRWKGKQRAEPVSFSRRDDDSDMGDGEGDGILLPLQYIGTEGTDASYSLEIQVGSSSQSISLQVDTGSSDLWIASTSCSSSPCENVPGDKRYDPTSSTTSTRIGAAFNINYLRGSVNGTIVFDTVSIGGYAIGGQALASVDSVDSESLSSSFSGLLGLALPANSVISSTVPPTDDSFDGATVASNIFSITPISEAPAARFLSLTLSRPGSDTVPALFGIGRHPSNIPLLDGSKVHYTSPLPSFTNMGTSGAQRFWKSSIRDITVWVDGQPKTVSVPSSGVTGGAGGLPTAVLDTGVPVILASKSIADGIYGAIGVGPASDGNYYVDCSTPLNLTITLDDRDPMSVHPLDLTLVPPSDISSKTCTGLIQAAEVSAYGDMILGVPFLRSVYMVMAYQVPNSDGSFPDLRPTEDSDSAAGAATVNEIRPRLGLQSLVDPSIALDEFHRVRVLGQSLSNSSHSADSGGDSGHLSVGVEVLLALIGFFALCFGLFALRFFLMKRKYGRADGGTEDQDRSLAAEKPAGGILGFWKRRRQSDHSTDEKARGEYELTGTGLHGQLQNEDALRQMRYQAYMSKERLASQYSTSTAQTRVADEYEAGDAGEFGIKKKRTSVASHAASANDDHDRNNEVVHNVYDDPWDPSTALDWGENRATIVGTGRGDHRKKASDGSKGRSPSPPGERVPMLQDRQLSPTAPTFAHTRERSVDLPPLPHDDTHEVPSLPVSSDPTNDLEEFGSVSGTMAGIGTLSRGSMIDPDMQFSHSHHHTGSISSTASTLLNARPRPTRMPSGPRQSSTYSTSSLSNVYPSTRAPS